jgi:hypothetical protein
VLNQAAHADVKKKGSHFQVVFRRLLPYQFAIRAVAHRLCRMVWKILHEGVRFIEQGVEPDPKAKNKRARTLARALRKLGYEVAITPINPVTATNALQTLGEDFRGSVIARLHQEQIPPRSGSPRGTSNGFAP